MTAVADAKTVIDILTNGNADNAQMLRIANAFLPYAIDGTDINSPNEDKAANFLRVARETLKSSARNAAEGQEQTIADAQVAAAGDAVEADL